MFFFARNSDDFIKLPSSSNLNIDLVLIISAFGSDLFLDEPKKDFFLLGGLKNALISGSFLRVLYSSNFRYSSVSLKVNGFIFCFSLKPGDSINFSRASKSSILLEPSISLNLFRAFPDVVLK